MIVIGVILLLVGALAGVGLLFWLGLILLIVGVAFNLVGGRNFY